MITADILDFIVGSIVDFFDFIQSILLLQPYEPYFPNGLTLFDFLFSLFCSYFILDVVGFGDDYIEFSDDLGNS